jgi:serine protease Do
MKDTKILLLSSTLSLLLWFAPTSAQTTPTPDASNPPFVSVFVAGGGGFLGIYPEEITRENMARYGQSSPRGAGVSRVVEDSPAARAGLRQGDVILRFEGETITSVRKLNRLIGEVAPEHTVRLTIARGGSEQELSVTLAKRKDYSAKLEDLYGSTNSELLKRMENWGSNADGNFVFSLGASRRIGVQTTQLTKQLADYFGIADGRGLLVTSVVENSPAAKAGIKAGDIITALDNEKVEKASDLTRALNRKNEGEVTLTLMRDKSQRTLRLTPERRSEHRFDISPEIKITPQIGININPNIRITPRIKPINIKQLSIPQINIEPFTIPPIRLKPIKSLIALPSSVL